ncbi:hypothetical protein KC906_00415, partial [Candidatus Kaiserbacteria bacterium]|nr:hypothetical protein [Candidatus Kaiserbacteria bacterium]
MSNDDLDNRIEKERPTLSAEEKAAVLRVIEAKVAAPTPSPYAAFIHSRTKTMTGVLVALVVIVGTTGTVAASNDAKPGDLLFPIERAAERVQLAFAGEARLAELPAQFSIERLAELREIISEETESTEAEVAASSSASTSASVTVRESGEERIAKAVTAVLDSLEDFDDRDIRVQILTELQADIDKVKIAGRSETTTNVQTEDNTRVEIKDDRIEVRDDGFRLRIDDDGDVRVQVREQDAQGSKAGVQAEESVSTNFGDHDDDYEDKWEEEYEDEDEWEFEDEEEWEDDDDDHRGRDHDEDDSDDDTEWNGSIKKFEVRVEGLKAEVRVEYGSKKLEYNTVYTTKAALIAEVALRTGLTSAELESE